MPRRQQKLEARLQESASGVFVLDAQRRLTFVNSAVERATGWQAEDLLGSACHYVTEADPHSREAVLAVLSPPAEVLQGQPLVTPVFLPHRTEEATVWLLHWQPFQTAEQAFAGCLGFLRVPPAASPLPPVPASQQLHAELSAARRRLRRQYHDETLLGNSPAMQRVFRQLQLADTAATVLFVGEKGVGKEHLARVLHYRGRTGRRAFVPLNCVEIPSFEFRKILKQARESLSHSSQDLLGPGTLYLTNFEKLASDLQRDVMAVVLEKLDLRVMIASETSLAEAVTSGRLEKSVWWELSALEIAIPPLRDRGDDLPLWLQYFLEEQNRTKSHQLTGYQPAPLDRLIKYHWPGNLDEMQAAVRELADRCTSETIGLDDLPFRFLAGEEAQNLPPALPSLLIPLEELLAKVEREQILAALEMAQQNKSKAAELLGMTRPRLYRRLIELELVKEPPEPEKSGRNKRPARPEASPEVMSSNPEDYLLEEFAEDFPLDSDSDMQFEHDQ